MRLKVARIYFPGRYKRNIQTTAVGFPHLQDRVVKVVISFSEAKRYSLLIIA